MIAKNLVCGLVLGCIAVLTDKFDRSESAVPVSATLLPSCAASDSRCQETGSTDRFFAIMAMR